MKEVEVKVGFAFCASHCCMEMAIAAMEKAKAEFGEVVPIMSENLVNTDTRFGRGKDFKERVEGLCRRPVIDSIAAAEPFGPKNMADVLVIAPCTGNTLAKLAGGMTDTAVSMAAKSHLRNNKPVVLAFSTNDGLGNSLRNIAELMQRKNIYFVPFRQDDPMNKPNSLASDFTLINETVKAALKGRQIQPVLI